MPKLAIIGTGIAGLGSAHFLHRDFDLTLFEQNDYLGGHTHTVTVQEKESGLPLPIDTGFMVYNEVTYPNLTRLFAELDVPTKATKMSFSVHHRDLGLEFCGTSWNQLFAQRRNLLSRRFWKMLAAIGRFNTEAAAALEDPKTRQLTLREFVAARNYGEDFLNLYLQPMSSAVWSTPPALMMEFPAATLLRFFHNHGFLGMHTQHPWRTVQGGAKTYVERLITPWKEQVLVRKKATHVFRHPRGLGATVTTEDGGKDSFDHVIFACHADQALRLLPFPTPEEARLLGAFRYQTNVATLHTDRRVMPRNRRAWASWNYEIAGAKQTDREGASTATHYWMNSLQGISDREDYFVSIDRPETIDPRCILKQMTYEHPLFNLEAIEAQAQLPSLNTLSPGQPTFFCGSYFGYGFHEDAFTSSVNLARTILQRDPWTRSSVRTRPAVGVPAMA